MFQDHGADASGRAELRKKLRRDQVLAFFSQLQPCVAAMEACGGAHFWGREIGKLGHEVRLIPLAYVKPFVKRQKNDAADAEAICKAAQRPTMCYPAGDACIHSPAAVCKQTASIRIVQGCILAHFLRSRRREFAMTSSLRMIAVIASFLLFPDATN